MPILTYQNIKEWAQKCAPHLTIATHSNNSIYIYVNAIKLKLPVHQWEVLPFYQKLKTLI